MRDANKYLVLGGALSLLASVIHILIIFGGPDWYRFFGAGERMAHFAERGLVYPSLVTGFIALILAVWALYAFSGAGLIREMPFLKYSLAIIAFVYLSRGLLGIPIVLLGSSPYLIELKEKMIFMICSSLVCTFMGALYGIGVFQIWKKDR